MVNELEALLILCDFPFLGSVRIQQLIQFYGSAVAALHAKPSEIAKLKDFNSRIAESWKNWKNMTEWRHNMELAEKQGVEIISYKDPKYPKRLLELSDLPIVLYIKGELLPQDANSIAVVGTRQASIYGKEMAEKISEELAAKGFTVVSGLARGIDTSAHQGALRGGRTLAVIGSGLNDIYPQENTGLARSICQKGALISEFPMSTPPDRQNFPQRNRIVSGMTLGTLLIEAPLKSGAMITIEKAIGQNRRIFALPGRVDSENFKGNHYLIKTGKAELIENSNDIISNFENLFGSLIKPSHIINNVQRNISFEEQTFLKNLPSHEIAIDEIVQLTKLPVMKVNILITGLILKNLLKEFPGKVYKKSA